MQLIAIGELVDITMSFRQRSSHSESDGDRKDEEIETSHASEVAALRRSYHPSGSHSTSTDTPAGNAISSYFGSTKAPRTSQMFKETPEDTSEFYPQFHTNQPASPNSSFRSRKSNHHTKHGQGQPYNYGLPNSSPSPNRRVARIANRGSDKIRVCVRKRPLLKKEKREEPDIVKVSGSTVVVYEEKTAVDMSKFVHEHEYLFDEAFSEKEDNRTVFERSVKPLIQHVVEGGKSTCFAYGQTGSGKTYTIMGSGSTNPGLYLLAGDHLFRSLKPGQVLCVAYFEIYCGQLYDLLNGRAKLHAREDAKQRVNISNLRESRVNSIEELLALVAVGSKYRSVGASGVNPDSSRSHAVLQIQIKMTSKRVVENSNGRMSFIDLAGSERAAEAGDQNKQTRQEGAEINTSLLALKECIRSLDQDSKHTPFRQSKLTQVLKESFIGDSKTCMIANVSPTGTATDNTLNTLRYADRVKQLKAQCVAGGFGVGSTPSAPNVKITGYPKFTRKVKSLVAAQSPHKSTNEPNRASRKKRLVAGSSEPKLKRSMSDVTSTITILETTLEDSDCELHRSKSVEDVNNELFFQTEGVPLPRDNAPEPQQATLTLDSPSSESGSDSPTSEAPSASHFVHDSNRSQFSVTDNETFATNYLRHYAPRESVNLNVPTRKSVSSPDLRTPETEGIVSVQSSKSPDTDKAKSVERPSAVGREITGSKTNSVGFLKMIRSTRSCSLTPEKKTQALKTKASTEPTQSPKVQRKIVKFFGIESSTSCSELEPTVAVNNQNTNTVLVQMPPSTTPKRYSNSADDILRVISKSPKESSTSSVKTSQVGKLSFSDTRRRRSPSVSEDETSSPQTSSINVSKIPSDMADVQPAPPISKPRPNVRTTPRDRVTTPISAAKKMSLAEFAKQPPPKIGRQVGSFENLVQGQSTSMQSTLSLSETQATETAQKGTRSRNPSSGEEAQLIDSPRQQTSNNAAAITAFATGQHGRSPSSTSNSSPEQTLTSAATNAIMEETEDRGQPAASTSQGFTRSQSMRTNRGKVPVALTPAAIKRSRSQSPGCANQARASNAAEDQSISGETSKNTKTPTPSNIIHKAQATLILAHKDHLTQVSKCCTKELNCLKEMELGNKAFKDYVKQLETYLNRKQRAIIQMQNHLAEYSKLCEQASRSSNP